MVNLCCGFSLGRSSGDLEKGYAPSEGANSELTVPTRPAKQGTTATQRANEAAEEDREMATGHIVHSFPISTSYLNPWKASEYLDRPDVFGEGNYRLEQKFDRFTLIAEHDLTPEQHEELLKIAGRRKVRGV